MTNAFFLRVCKELTVDTRKYRYNVRTNGDVAWIERIALDKLDTTAALTDLEFVAYLH